MSNGTPFRDMRRALTTTQAEIQLLLAAEEIPWSQEEYALFFALVEMTRNLDNPTRTQILTILGVWLRFYRRLIERLPDGDALHVAALAEFAKLSAPFQHLLEVQPA